MPISLGRKLELKAKDIFRRVTLNRITTIFFVFTLIQCFAQSIMHSFLFTVDVRYFSLLDDISQASNLSAHRSNYTYPPTVGKDMTLLMCNDVNVYNPEGPQCEKVFDSNTDILPPLSMNQNSILRGQVILNIMNNGDGSIFRVLNSSALPYLEDPIPDVTALYDETIHPVQLNSSDGIVVLLNQQCAQILSYPRQHMQNAEREDLTWVILQFYLFTMTFLAIIWNSVPHLMAELFVRTLITAWSCYCVWRTLHQKDVFYRLVGQPGTPCSVDMFSSYFDLRFGYQIVDTVLSIASLFVGTYFTLYLMRVYNNQAFKAVGAPPHVMKLYKFFHALQATLQLEVFVLTTTVGLWIDQFYNTYIGTVANGHVLYTAGYITMGVLLIPWLVLGWQSIRREHKGLMILFLVICSMFIAGPSAVFYAQVFRWTFLMWPNVASFSVLSLILLITSFGLGIFSWRHFGQGLRQYMYAEQVLQSSHFSNDRFEHDVEKNGISYDPDAIVYELKGEKEKDAKDRLSMGSFSAETAAPMQPQPTYYLPTLSRLKTGSISSSFVVGSPTTLNDSPITQLSPMRKDSRF